MLNNERRSLFFSIQYSVFAIIVGHQITATFRLRALLVLVYEERQSLRILYDYTREIFISALIGCLQFLTI